MLPIGHIVFQILLTYYLIKFFHITDDMQKGDGNESADSTSSSSYESFEFKNEDEEDNRESTNLFDDTVNSLTPPTGKFTKQ